MIYNPRVLELHTQEQLRAELDQFGAEFSSLRQGSLVLDEQMARATFCLVKLRAVTHPLARLLYQELTMEGGQVVTPARVDHVGPGTVDVLLCATRYQFQHLVVRLRWQSSEELQLYANELEQVLDNYVQPRSGVLSLGDTRLEWGARTYLMGIVNVTPNSFSGDGLIHPGDTSEVYATRAWEHARQLAAQGADVLDIGGESTHPRAEPVDAAAELARVLPVVQVLARELKVPLSIDTYKAEVARAALQAGAVMVNDVWGLRHEPELGHVIAEYGAAVVLNHNWLDTHPSESNDFIGDIIQELRAQVESALEAGIRPEKILIDPGLGFGKTVEQNLELLDRLGELRVLGLPILIGPSRKGFVRRVLDTPAGEQDEGTATATALGIARGADLVRVHDVQAMARTAKIADAIVRKNHKK